MNRVTVVLALLIASSGSAVADVEWTLHDVSFSNGAVARGYYYTDTSGDVYSLFSLQVSYPSYTATVSVESPSEEVIGAGIDPGYSSFLILTLAEPMTADGGTIAIQSGEACNAAGCGTLDLSSRGHDPTITGTATPSVALTIFNGHAFAVSSVPEPSQALLLGIFGLVLTLALRRTLSKASRTHGHSKQF